MITPRSGRLLCAGLEVSIRLISNSTPNDIDIRDVSEQGEAGIDVVIDVVIDGEAQIYCYECALINQGKVDHASAQRLLSKLKGKILTFGMFATHVMKYCVKHVLGSSECQILPSAWKIATKIAK
jgi:hypothetical protein